MLPRPPSPNPPYPFASGNASISATYDRKQKQRSIMGITAGAEDVKYQAKYRELKKKVKEIESDNDRLYFKLLLAKKNIRRMNLERAILYERLAAVPPTPGRHTQELPAEQDPIFHPQPPAPPEHARAIDPNDREIAEYLRTHPTARLITGPDGRVVAIEDTPTVDSRGVAVQSGPPPPHGVPLVYGFRHDSGPGYDPARQLPPPPPMIPLLQPQEVPSEVAAPNEHQAHVYQYAQSRPPPQHNSHSHSSSSHQSRSSSVRPDLDSVSGGNQRVDASNSSYPVHNRSPNIPAEPSAGHRSRRHDVQELAHMHGQPLPPPHIQIPQQNAPSSPPMVSPTAHDRGSTRLHNHQRIGPGAHIHRERDPERDWELQQKLQYERELEREREEQRAIELRHRLEIEEREEEALWAQEEARVRARALSRSGSPGPAPRAGGSRDASRPGSGQAHDPDRPPRSYAPHVSNLLGIERDSGYKEGERSLGSGSRDRVADALPAHGGESRKRSREEMEIDDRYETEPRAVNESGAASRGAVNAGGNRGSRRSNSGEDGDAGHPPSGKGEELPDERMDEDT